jgi:hypothetical protein
LECIFRPTKGDNPAWARDPSLARPEHYNPAQPVLANEAWREIPARPDSPNPAQPGRAGEEAQPGAPGKAQPGAEAWPAGGGIPAHAGDAIPAQPGWLAGREPRRERGGRDVGPRGEPAGRPSRGAALGRGAARAHPGSAGLAQPEDKAPAQPG